MPDKQALGSVTKLACAYALPFALVAVLDVLFLHSTSFNSYSDNDTSFFGIGLNWVTLTPPHYFHHPSYFFTELSGLLVALGGYDSDTDSVRRFIFLGNFVNLSFIALSAVWIGRCAQRLGMSFGHVLAIGFMAAAMPAVYMRVTHFSTYTCLGALFPAIGLALYESLKNRNRKGLAFCAFWMGFALGNFFPVAVLVLGLVLVLLINAAERGNLSFGQFRSAVLAPAGGWRPGSIALIAVYSLLIGINAGHGGWVYSSGGIVFTLVAAVFGAGCGALAGAVFLGIGRLSGWGESWVGNLIAGWLFGTTLLFPYYLWTLIVGFSSSDTLSTFYLDYFVHNVLSTPWLLYLFLIGLILFLAVLYRIQRWGWQAALPPDAIITPVVAFFLFTALVSLYLLRGHMGSLLHSVSPAQPQRTMLTLLAPMSFAWAYISGMTQASRRASRVGLSLAGTIIGLVAMASMFTDLKEHIDDYTERGERIDALIEQFWASEPDGVVFCLGVGNPSVYCATGYAFNRYRKAQSIARLPTERLFDNRLVWPKHPKRNLASWTTSKTTPVLLVARKSGLQTAEGAGWKRVDTLLHEKGIVVERMIIRGR